MRWILTIVTISAVLLGATAAAWSCSYGSVDVLRVLSDHPETRAKAIAKLRQDGPSGMEDVAAMRDMFKEQLVKAAPENQARLQQSIAKLNAVMDELGNARYCSVSKLYWYTDLEHAKQRAALLNKPILSLRMLGKLNEEYSCANSRFFRTTLYSNREIADTLRRDFVLHWESVRPVPRVTIDFGDGRKLHRTLTGNSIHYLLDKDGRPLDGLPGLHSPEAFKTWLTQSTQLAQGYSAADAGERDDFLQKYHAQRLESAAQAFATDLRRVQETQADVAVNNNAAQRQQPPRAEVAANIAMPKRRAEIGILREVAVDRRLPATMEELDEATWQKIAALHADASHLDESSVAVIRAENPAARLAGRRAVSKALVEDPLARLVAQFESSIALDTVRNEYILHRHLHEWFAGGNAEREIAPLNERVYAQLFLTPNSDPWLGLMSPDTYTALTNNGVAVDAQQ